MNGLDELFRNAFFVEVVQFVLASLSMFFEVWMIYDTSREYLRVKDATILPDAWRWQGLGNAVTELWRGIVAVHLVGIGWYLVTHEVAPNRSFWDWQANTNIWRILVLTMTFSEFAGALTSRWCRRQADQADRAQKLSRVASAHRDNR